MFCVEIFDANQLQKQLPKVCAMISKELSDPNFTFSQCYSMDGNEFAITLENNTNEDMTMSLIVNILQNTVIGHVEAD